MTDQLNRFIPDNDGRISAKQAERMVSNIKVRPILLAELLNKYKVCTHLRAWRQRLMYDMAPGEARREYIYWQKE